MICTNTFPLYRYSEVPTDMVAFQGECIGSELSLHHCSTTGQHMCIDTHIEHYVGIVCNKVSYHKEATQAENSCYAMPIGKGRSKGQLIALCMAS
jgi:hypothetical protein